MLLEEASKLLKTTEELFIFISGHFAQLKDKKEVREMFTYSKEQFLRRFESFAEMLKSNMCKKNRFTQIMTNHETS